MRKAEIPNSEIIDKLFKLFVEKRKGFGDNTDKWHDYLVNHKIEVINDITLQHFGYLFNSGYLKDMTERTFCVDCPWTGTSYILVPKNFALKVLALGYLP